MSDRSGVACAPLNNVLSISTDSEDSNFPIENTQDEHPKRIYKALTNSITISAIVPEGTESFFVFNTNATSATLKESDQATGEWFTGNSWFDGNEWWPLEVNIYPITIVESGERNAIGFRFDPLPRTKLIELTLESPVDTVVEVGILWSGEIHETNNFRYGMSESQVDYSISKQLSNGAFYYKKRDIVRMFTGMVLDEYWDQENATEAEYIDGMLLDVSRTYGKKSMPWIITDLGGSRWLVFGRLSDLMRASYRTCRLADLSIKIIEVL